MKWHASNGLRPWIVQRVSALYMIAFVAFFIYSIFNLSPLDYGKWSAWVAHPMVNILLALFLVSLMLHAWVGIRDVIVDYVHIFVMRLVLFVLIAIGLFAMTIWLIQILFTVSH